MIGLFLYCRYSVGRLLLLKLDRNRTETRVQRGPGSSRVREARIRISNPGERGLICTTYR